MTGIYRQSSIERISSPDQLDRMLKITTPLSWAGITAASVITALVLAWSVWGTIPSTISVTGFWVAPYSTNTVFCPVPGTVSAVYLQPGDLLEADTPIMEIVSSTGKVVSVVSGQEGVLSSILVDTNTYVSVNSELARLSPNTAFDLVILCYLDSSMAREVRPGMKAVVTLHSAGHTRTDYFRATVSNVDDAPVTTEAVTETLGPDGARYFSDHTSLTAVTCIPDEDLDPWTDMSDASPLLVDESTVTERDSLVRRSGQVDVQLILSESRPLDKIFPNSRG